MNLAQPAGRVSPAFAEMDNDANQSQKNDEEYFVQPADNLNELDNHDLTMNPVEPAVIGFDDAKQIAQINQAKDPKTENGNNGISVDMLKQGPTGIAFEGAAGICRGMDMHVVRRVTLALSKFLPAIYDQRDFVSYGEILRYIVIKDNILFVYAEKTDPNYLYTISLDSLHAVKEDGRNPHNRSVTVSPGYGTGKDRQDGNIVNVLLLEARNKLVYQIAFNIAKDETIADNFVNVVQRINKVQKRAEEIQKK